MTADLYGPGGPGLSLGWPPSCTFLSPTAGIYILMPESLSAHNNTIGLTGFCGALSLCQTFAILRLTL
jgi:hypothetical protein